MWLNIEDFSWEDHAFTILHKYNAPLAEAINRQSEFALQMTRGTFGSEKVDTWLFRTSIANYLMGIHGIRDDAV